MIVYGYSIIINLTTYTIGMTLSMPLAILSDIILNKNTIHYSNTYIIGTIIIIISFIIVNINEFEFI